MFLKRTLKKNTPSPLASSTFGQHRRNLDLSCVQLDGSHTPCKRGGEAVGYQGRKSTHTTNTIYLADNQGQMLYCASPQEGQHKDLFELQALFEEICQFLTAAGIDVKGVFLNADAGFDSKEFRETCLLSEAGRNKEPAKEKPSVAEKWIVFCIFLFVFFNFIECSLKKQENFIFRVLRYLNFGILKTIFPEFSNDFSEK